VVHTGQNLFRQQAVAVYLHHPLFGVVASYFIMHDTLTLAFGAAALLVIAGLYLVNRPDLPAEARARSQRSGVTALFPA